MRIPVSPPKLSPDLLLGQKGEPFGPRLGPVDGDGRYLPWEEFRRRPAPEGMKIEEAWAHMRFSRLFRAVRTAFKDKTDIPFMLTEFSGLRHRLHQIDSRARGALASPATRLQKQDGERHLMRSLIEEPFSSSVLEGAATTRERAKLMIEQGQAPLSEDDRMVLNNHLAMQFIRENTDQDLTVELVNEIHRIVTAQTLEDPSMGGRFRGADNDINVVDSVTGEHLHRPPKWDSLPDRMKLLCEFANEDYSRADPFLSPVVRGVLLHFMLAYDHPYVDGNGRTARALFYWYVLKQGYWLLEYISISKLIREAPHKYGMAFLYSETDGGDITYFVIHQLDVILGALDALDGYLEEKVRERSEFQSKLEELQKDKTFNLRQAALLEGALRNPSIRFTIREHGQQTGVTYLTARKDLDDLADAGFFVRGTGRPIIYRPKKNIAALLGEN